MWWTPAKLVAVLLIGGIVVGVTCQVVVHAVLVFSSRASDGASLAFDVLYEKVAGIGSRSFETRWPEYVFVTAVVPPCGWKPVATDGRGKPMDVASLPMGERKTTAGRQCGCRGGLPAAAG